MAKIAVAPLVGAWIEIIYMEDSFHLIAVAPLVGAWIEMVGTCYYLLSIITSLPSWERGLKYIVWDALDNKNCRSPRGSVD